MLIVPWLWGGGHGTPVESQLSRGKQLVGGVCKAFACSATGDVHMTVLGRLPVIVNTFL
jgi:hypothetical protein